MKWTLRLAFGALGFAALFIGGWAVGTWLGDARAGLAASKRAVARSDNLKDMVEGISVGNPFPNIDLWTPSGDTARPLDDVLPNGGLLLYTAPTCGSCLDAAHALEAEVKAGRISPNSIVVSDDCANTLEFEEKLRHEGIELGVYCDAPQALRSVHHVIHNPAHFLLDSAGVVRGMGVWVKGSDFKL